MLNYLFNKKYNNCQKILNCKKLSTEGLEPTTTGLKDHCSTIELCTLLSTHIIGTIGLEPMIVATKKRCFSSLAMFQ